MKDDSRNGTKETEENCITSGGGGAIQISKNCSYILTLVVISTLRLLMAHLLLVQPEASFILTFIESNECDVGSEPFQRQA